MRNKFQLKTYSIFIAIILIGSISVAQNKGNDHRTPKSKVKYIEHPFSIFQVKPIGIFKKRMQLNLTQLIRHRNRHIQYAGWGADQLGRWIGTTSLESTILNQKQYMPLIQSKVKRLLSVQDKNGLFFGDSLRAHPHRFREVWFGQGRALWNLLDYYNLTKNKAVLKALNKAAKYTVKSLKHWTIPPALSTGIESAVSPMTRLGEMEHKNSYINWSEFIANKIPHVVPPPSPVPPSPTTSIYLDTAFSNHRHHAHSYLSVSQGIVDLAVATGNVKYLKQAEKIFHETAPSVWANGSMPEGYGNYYEEDDETCTIVDWIMLGLKLYAATDKAKYLDAVELSALNGLLFNEDHHGGFDTQRSLDREYWLDKNNWGGEQPQCCSMSGGWSMTRLSMYTITSNNSGLSVNLPIEVNVSANKFGGKISALQKIDVEKYNFIQNISINNSTQKNLQIKIRVPYWCDNPELLVNSKRSGLKPDNRFYYVTAPEGEKTNIKMILPMKLKIIPPRRDLIRADKKPAPGDATQIGLQYGPYVLMYDRELFPDIKKRVSLKVFEDEKKRPIVNQNIPQSWLNKGAVPLALLAKFDGKTIVLLPCADMTMNKFTLMDPYVLRFEKIKITKVKNNGVNSLPHVTSTAPTIYSNSNVFVKDTKVRLASFFNSYSPIYYTLDGSAPTVNSLKYTGPITITGNTTLKTCYIWKDGSKSKIAERHFKKVTPINSISVNNSNLVKGLSYKYYEGTWKYLPEFNKLKPVREGKVSRFDITQVQTRENHFAILFDGYINIPATCPYKLYLTSDDGSKLFINGKLIIDNDGSHGSETISKSVVLEKGYHPIKVEYFQDYAGKELRVSYKYPGKIESSIPEDVLFTNKSSLKE